MPETTQFPESHGENQSLHSLKPNTVLLARYKILGVLGGGGMGTVYQARDLNFPDIKRLVAIKEMHNTAPDPTQRANMIKTFRREANILATLSHPAIPKIYDFFDRNDRAYLVMEYINGSDLETLLQKTKVLPIDKIIEWGITLCDVLDYLHNQPEPIMFRDMKPANVMIDNLGKVRLIDFGIAKTFVSGVKQTMIGTEGYSAPEQYRGKASPLSDIYGLGATLHHVITRKDPRLEPPFSFNERPISKFNETAPAGLITVIDKATATEPTERYQSCGEMKAMLEQVSIGQKTGMYMNMPAMTDSANGEQPAGSTIGLFMGEGGSGGTIQPKWVFEAEDEIRSSPTAFDDTVYFGSYDTNVYALNIETGEQQWKYPTKGGIASSPVIDIQNKTVLFGSEDGTFSAVDMKRGRLSWSHTTTGRIRSSPRVAHGYVFFGSDDFKVYAILSVNGRLAWEYNVEAPVRSKPFVTNELVIFGAESGEVMALELNGTRKWVYRTKRNVMSSPYVDPKEGICYVGSSDYYMYALDVNTGYNSWRSRTGGSVVSSPVVYDGLVYFGSADGNFYAINAQSSREKWKFNIEKPIIGSPAIHEDSVYFGGTDEHLYCLDAKTGKEKWKFKTGGSITSTPLIVNNTVIVGSMDNKLYAIPLVG